MVEAFDRVEIEYVPITLGQLSDQRQQLLLAEVVQGHGRDGLFWQMLQAETLHLERLLPVVIDRGVYHDTPDPTFQGPFHAERRQLLIHPYETLLHQVLGLELVTGIAQAHSVHTPCVPGVQGFLTPPVPVQATLDELAFR